MNNEQRIMDEIVPEVFRTENGFHLEAVHLRKEGLLIKIGEPAAGFIGVKLSQDEVMRFKKWFDEYYGLFF